MNIKKVMLLALPTRLSDRREKGPLCNEAATGCLPWLIYSPLFVAAVLAEQFRHILVAQHYGHGQRRLRLAGVVAGIDIGPVGQ